MIRRFGEWWERHGLTVPVIFAWVPFWGVLALMVGDKTAKTVLFWIAMGPFAIGFTLVGLVFLGLPFCATRPLERVGALPIVGFLAWRAGGTTIAGIYVAAIVAAWLLRDGRRGFKAKGNDLITPSAAAYRPAPLE